MCVQRSTFSGRFDVFCSNVRITFLKVTSMASVFYPNVLKPCLIFSWELLRLTALCCFMFGSSCKDVQEKSADAESISYCDIHRNRFCHSLTLTKNIFMVHQDWKWCKEQPADIIFWGLAWKLFYKLLKF